MSGMQLMTVVLCIPIFFYGLYGIRHELQKEHFLVRFLVKFCSSILMGILIIILLWVMNLNVEVDVYIGGILDFYISVGMLIPYLYNSFLLSSFGLFTFMLFKVFQKR